MIGAVLASVSRSSICSSCTRPRARPGLSSWPPRRRRQPLLCRRIGGRHRAVDEQQPAVVHHPLQHGARMQPPGLLPGGGQQRLRLLGADQPGRAGRRRSDGPGRNHGSAQAGPRRKPRRTPSRRRPGWTATRYHPAGTPGTGRRTRRCRRPAPITASASSSRPRMRCRAAGPASSTSRAGSAAAQSRSAAGAAGRVPVHQPAAGQAGARGTARSPAAPGAWPGSGRSPRRSRRAPDPASRPRTAARSAGRPPTVRLPRPAVRRADLHDPQLLAVPGPFHIVPVTAFGQRGQLGGQRGLPIRPFAALPSDVGQIAGQRHEPGRPPVRPRRPAPTPGRHRRPDR